MEEVLPPETQNGSGYEMTRVRQFTIFLENRVGRLQGLLQGIEDSLELQRSSLTRFSEPCLKLDGTKRATMLRLFRYEGWEDKVVAERKYYQS